MSLIGASIQKRALMQQKSTAQFQQMTKMNTLTYYTELIGNREAQISDVNSKIDVALNAYKQDKDAAGDAKTCGTYYRRNLDNGVKNVLQQYFSADYNTFLTTTAKKDIKLSKLDKGTDGEFVYLKGEQDRLDMEKDSLDSQLEIIEAQLKSMDGLVQNSVEQDCTLWCVGGGG